MQTGGGAQGEGVARQGKGRESPGCKKSGDRSKTKAGKRGVMAEVLEREGMAGCASVETESAEPQGGVYRHNNSLTAEKTDRCGLPRTPFLPFLLRQVKRSCPSGGLEAGTEKEGGNPFSVQLIPPELVSLWGLARIVNAGLRGSL